MKYHIKSNLKKELSEIECDEKVTPTEWFLLHLLKMKNSFATFFPLLISIAEAILCIPVSNAWPVRGASSIKNVKTRLRNRLTNNMLEGLLHILINGPKVNDCALVVEKAVDKWLKAKKRRKLPKKQLEKGIKTQHAILLSDTDNKTEMQRESDDLTENEIVENGIETQESEEVTKNERENFEQVAKSLDLDVEDHDSDSEYDDDDDDEDDDEMIGLLRGF